MTFPVKLFSKIPRKLNSNTVSIFVLSIFSKEEVATFLLVVLKNIHLVLFTLRDNVFNFSHSLTLFNSILITNSAFPFCSNVDN